jgi:hypothetical protein
MKADRVMGWTTLYAVMTENAYANIKTAVLASSGRMSATRESTVGWRVASLVVDI